MTAVSGVRAATSVLRTSFDFATPTDTFHTLKDAVRSTDLRLFHKCFDPAGPFGLCATNRVVATRYMKAWAWHLERHETTLGTMVGRGGHEVFSGEYEDRLRIYRFIVDGKQSEPGDRTTISFPKRGDKWLISGTTDARGNPS